MLDFGAYLRYQRGTGNRVVITQIKTTPEQDLQIIELAEGAGQISGGFCARATSGALSVCGLEQSWLPNSVLNDALELKGRCPTGKKE